MPRPPASSRSTSQMPAAVYSPFAGRQPASGRDPLPLHVGDTWLEPWEGARMEALATADHPGLHRYGDTRGHRPLLEALAARTRASGRPELGVDSHLVVGGATAGLAAAVGAIADPGDEVLILAPFWPLIRGIVQACGAVPVEVPFYDRVASAEEAVAAVASRAGPRSVALYVSTPSNPTGRVLPEAWLRALADWARDTNLRLLSDEVYEAFVYRGRHVSLASLAPERTLSAHSFSKTYGMAGNRVGWLAGPTDWVAEAHKLGVHSVYHAPTASQVAALRALEGADGWVARARKSYEEVGRACAERLGVTPPEGSTFLFLDVGAHLDGRGLPGFLEDCFEAGVLVAPGSSSGRDYERWIRLCYTAVGPEAALEGVDRIARLLGR